MTKLIDAPDASRIAAPANSVKDIFAERREAATQFMSAQERGDSWKMLPGSRPVTLAEARNGVCRWPLGNPRDLETFRFCGEACDATGSYCEVHTQLAITPSRPRMATPANAPLKKVA